MSLSRSISVASSWLRRASTPQPEEPSPVKAEGTSPQLPHHSEHEPTSAPAHRPYRSLYATEPKNNDGAWQQKLALRRLKVDDQRMLQRDLLPGVLANVQEVVQNIMNDEFSKCFVGKTERPVNWNIHLAFTWALGLALRYLILFPLRFFLLLAFTLIFLGMFFLVKLWPRSAARKRVLQWLLCCYCRTCLMCIHAAIRHRRGPPKTFGNTIFVANHTSLLDAVVLASCQPYAMVGQQHKGLVGFFQNHVLSVFDCIFFERDEQTDRRLTVERLKKHLSTPGAAPLLVFPEGTCVNNKYCVMFKKGAFELGATIIPYHKYLGDPFWNSRTEPFWFYCLKLMCFWGVHADVWYLEPEHQRPGESPIEFAARTRALIAEQGNLRTTNYDGYFKHFRPSPRFVEERQRRIAANYQRLFAAAPSGVTTAPASPLVGPCEQSPFAMGGTESTIPTPTTEPLPTPAPLPQLPPLAKTVAASGGGADVNTGRAGADEASGLLFVPPTRSTLCVAEELQRGEGALLRPRAVI